jgi:hypothetical protein
MSKNPNDPIDIDLDTYLGDFTDEELSAVKDLISSKKTADLINLRRSIYRTKCPTPKEFLEEWISRDIYDGLFPFVKESFIDIWDWEEKFNEVILYGGTRIGKSVIVRLCVVYCIVFLWCLKDPHKFYGINKMSGIAVFLMSFSKIKAQALLLSPITTILQSSPKFHQVLELDRVTSTQERLGTEKIVWTTADKIGELGFAGNLHICLGANPLDIIGADIILAVVSEINFFIEAVGIAEEDVWRVFTDTKDRIFGTVGKKYGAMMILDSSANNRDSIIESYILEEAVKAANVYYMAANRWTGRPELYPIWGKTGETFEVFIGTNSRAAALVDSAFTKLEGDDKHIIKVPIDAFEFFKKNLLKSLKDQAGIPSGSENLFFSDWEVFDNLWDANLINVTQPTEIPMTEDSKGLLFNLMKHTCFKQEAGQKYRLKRAPAAPRWIHVDLSESENYTGVAMIHPEITNEGVVLGIYDFAMDIKPGKEGINLDAILTFVRELYKEHGVNIAGISTDRHQSSFIKQAVAKDGKKYQLVSVDTDKAPYMVFKTKILSGLLRVGRYMNIENNLKSLIDLPNKIDHSTGKSKRGNAADWQFGKNAKDISDALSASAYFMYQELGKHSIRYNYDDINKVLDLRRSFNTDEEPTPAESADLYQRLIGNLKKNQKAAKPNIGV